MTRFVYTPLHSTPWFVLLLLAALLLPVCVQAELRAALSAQIIDELDSVQLVVRDIGTRQSETPDLSGLERDFHVLGVNTSSQYRFVNGQAQSWVDYQITLQPKRTGELIIPPIGIGQQRTDSIPISVRALSADMRRKIDALVFYEMELSSDSVYVQSQLLLTRRLVYADGVQLYGGQLETPVLDGAQVFALGEGQSSVIQRNGRTMGSYEQRYAIFPEQSGTLTLPSDAVTASVRVVDGMSTARKTVRISTQEQRIVVHPIPAEYPADQPWLPAIAVTASVDFEPSPAQTVNVGDTIGRTLTVTVIGNTGTSVPPTALSPNEDEFKTYVQPTTIENETFGENLVGYRIEAVDLVPITPGALGIPDTRITWWNTDTESVMTTEIPRRALSVEGLSIADSSPEPALAAKTPIKNTPQLGGTVQSNANGLNAWTATSAVAILCLIGFVWRKRQRRRMTIAPATPSAAPRVPAPSLKQLIRSTKRMAPLALRSELAAYLTHATRADQASAMAAFCASGDSAKTSLAALNAACYGAGEFNDSDREQISVSLKRFAQQLKRVPVGNRTDLPHLYPR